MKHQSGFTLVEVLVAFAILAVVLVALYEAAGTGLRSFQSAAQVERAVLVAQSELDRIVALKHLPATRRGRIQNAPFEWDIELPELPVAPELKALRSTRPVLVRLNVRWQGEHAARHISIDRLIFVAAGAN